MFNEKFQTKTARMIVKREEATARQEQIILQAVLSVMEDGVKGLMEQKDVSRASTGILSVIDSISHVARSIAV